MISLEVVWLLLNGFAAGKLAAFQLFWPFVRPGGGVLLYYLAFFVAALAALIVLQTKSKHRDRTVFWIATAAVLIVTLTAAARQLAYRQVERQPTTDNDGVIQSEAAARFFLAGENPYDQSFAGTKFGHFPSPVGPGAKNLADDHYAYFPLPFLLFTPTVWINDHYGTHFDYQLQYFVLWLAFCGLLILITPTWRWRTRIVLLTAGNPWLWNLALAGFNDILYVGLIALAAVLLWRRWPVAASVAFGLALASKQTAWLVIPLWVFWLWHTHRQDSTAQRYRWLGISAITAAVILVPFFLWSPSAMFDDTVRYVSGAIPLSYPLSGHTVLQYLRVLGFVDSPWSMVAAWPTQLIAWVGMSWLGFRALRAKPSASVFLWTSGGMLLAVTLFSRFAPDNYLLAIGELLIAAYVLSLTEEKESHA